MSAIDYTVTRTDRGVVIDGGVPVTPDLVGLLEWAQSLGFTIVDGWLAHHYGVGMVITSKEISRQWRAELGYVGGEEQ